MTNQTEDRTNTRDTTAVAAAVDLPGGTIPQAPLPNTPDDEDDFAFEPHIVRGLD
ncbi:hypothetical protein [Streptomyces sp. cg40]|uniref:hypothetical protein n=1 Tax=Streptomyces sp. cg40 TaxID=3419764 RepID=UPI003D04EB0D